MLAPFIKIPNLIKELAISQDIDPDKLVNDMNEAAIYAEMLKGLQNAQQGTGTQGDPAGQQQAGVGGAGGVPQGSPPTDNSGLVTAQLEPELRQLQGKVALLEMLLNLKNNYDEVIRNVK